MDYNQLEIKDLIDKVIVLSMKVHSRLKNGFVEEVYKKSLSIELNKLKIPHSVEQQLNVYYDGQLVGAYRADIVICNKLRSCLIMNVKFRSPSEQHYNSGNHKHFICRA